MKTDQQFVWISRLLGTFGLALIAATWPLWTTSTMPQIPWLECLLSVPQAVDQLAIVVAGMSLLALVIDSQHLKIQRYAVFCFVGSWSVLLSLDQHRLQPWAWQFLIIACLLTSSKKTTALAFLRWLAISIYLYSAWSKVDASFLTSHGQLLLSGFLTALDINTEFWSPQTKQLLAALMPAGEMLVGILLISKHTQRWGVLASIFMHVCLIMTLGPWGLNHETGVLIWNVYFIFQNIVLFWLFAPVESPVTWPSQSFSQLYLQALMTVVLVCPLLESVGYWDHWPAWAVYCSRPEKVEVLIDAAHLDQLPAELNRYLGQPEPLSDQVPLHLDALAFGTRFCPLYPQGRYRLALTLALFSHSALREEAVRVKIKSTPNRWTGERKELELDGLFALADECEIFLLNTRPRSD